MKQAIVECVRDGEVIAAYEFGIPESIGPTTPPSHASLVEEAKVNLSNHRLAAPPWEGITFRVKWP